MKAPMYVERNLGMERYRERCQQLLHKQITQIQNRKSPFSYVDDDLLQRVNESKIRAHYFSLSGSFVVDKLDIVRESHIQKENKKILDKLAEISEGKLSMFRDKMRESEERAVKSLNFHQRKKENERIERENLRFARRLLEKPASINVKGIESEFDQYMRYRKLHLKVPQKKEYSKVLPPISKESSSKTDKQEEKTTKQSKTGKQEKRKEDKTSKHSKTDKQEEKTTKHSKTDKPEEIQKANKKTEAKEEERQKEEKKDTPNIAGDDLVAMSLGMAMDMEEKPKEDKETEKVSEKEDKKTENEKVSGKVEQAAEKPKEEKKDKVDEELGEKSETQNIVGTIEKVEEKK